MGESGSVAYMFDHKGLLVMDREEFDTDEDTMMMQALEYGAEDVIVNEDSFEILTHAHEFEQVKNGLEKEKLHVRKCRSSVAAAKHGPFRRRER